MQGGSLTGDHRFASSVSTPWPLLTKEQAVKKTPSRKDGVSKAEERKRKMFLATVMGRAGKKLGLWPEKTVATAILYTIRFFSAKSLARNDGFLVATAALFLAGKVENQPRHLNDVMRHCFLEYYVGHHGDKAKRQFEDPTFFQELSEYVLTAERSLMYTLSFTLQVEHPYSVIFRALKAMTEASDPKIMNNFISNIYTSQHYPVLLYDLRHIAYCAIRLTFKLRGVEVPKMLLSRKEGDRLEKFSGYCWETDRSCTPEKLDELEAEILKTYDRSVLEVNLADPEGHHRKRPDPAPAGPRTPSAEEIAAHAAGLQDDAAAPAANGAVSVQARPGAPSVAAVPAPAPVIDGQHSKSGSAMLGAVPGPELSETVPGLSPAPDASEAKPSVAERRAAMLNAKKRGRDVQDEETDTPAAKSQASSPEAGELAVK